MDKAFALAPEFLGDPATACHGIPTDVFFPHDGDTAGIAAAKQICRGCPFVAECRDWAVDHYQSGIWGATTDEDRVSIRKRGGAKTRMSKPKQRRLRVVAMLNDGLPAAHIASVVGVADRTVHRIRRELIHGVAA